MKILAIGDFHGKFPKKLKDRIKKENVDLIVGLGDYTGIKEWYPYLMKIFKLREQGKEVPTVKEFFGKEKYKLLLKKDYLAGKKILSELDKLKKPVLIIFGNSDDEWYKYPFDKNVNLFKKRTENFMKKLKNIKVITYGKAKFKEINFIGFGGYMDIDKYKNERIDGFEDEERIKKVIDRMTKSKKKLFNLLQKTKNKRIFVFHYPLKGVFDKIKDKKNPRHGTSAGINFFRDAIKKYKPALVLCGHMHEYQGVKKLGKTLIINPGAAIDGKAVVIDIGKDKIKKIKFLK